MNQRSLTVLFRSLHSSSRFEAHGLSWLFVAVAVIAWAPAASAGFFEAGFSGSYRRSNIDRDAFDEAQSVSGSLSYFLDPTSAIELSYTDGINRRVIGDNQPTGHVTNMYYKMAGLDFVLTIGGTEDSFRPYVKAGAAYIIEKRILDQYRSAGTVFPASEIKEEPATVPSAGIGFKLSLTKTLQFKIGVDAWTSRPIQEKPVTIDYSARAGLSYFL